MTTTRKILLVVGARPNFMKAAPLFSQLCSYPKMLTTKLIHTGQHYDADMSDIFFEDLDLPKPDYFLGVGSGTHAEQTAGVMVGFERVCLDEHPDIAIVVGDVNSTMACAITAKKLCIPVAHVEAGLRSHDRTMPEEINRVLTDAISDFLFTPSRDADENLLREGIERKRIHFVGNVMIDCLLAQLPKAVNRDTLSRFGVSTGDYAILTLHRPSNVDNEKVFRGIVDVMMELSQELPIIWPAHPRSRKSLENLGLISEIENRPCFKLTNPIGYLDMLTLNHGAKLILTDSGGLQEEAAVLGVQCVTLRENTERPVTVAAGGNQIVGCDPAKIRAAVYSVLNGNGRPKIRIPELWDGNAARRIVRVLSRHYSLGANPNLAGGRDA